MGRVSLCMVLSLCVVASVTAEEFECGWQSGGKHCDNNLCCSKWGHCGSTEIYCSSSNGCQSNCKDEFVTKVPAPEETYECGWQIGGKLCDNNLCCSHWGHCGITDIYCLPSNDCQSNCKGEVDTNVTATYAYLNPEGEHKWDLKQANVFCAQYDGAKPLEWRSKYEWTGFCGPNGPTPEDACGKCLRVTNTGTGAQVTVRIVDTCGNEGLDLDVTPFEEIDTDGKGAAIGHLDVSYHFVDCGDELRSVVSMI